MRLLATCFTAVVMAAAATTTAAAVETGHQPHSASSAAAAVAAAAAGPPFAYGVGPSLHYNSADKETLRVMKQALASRSMKELVDYIGGVMQELCKVNDLFQRESDEQHRWRDTPFHATERPAVSISDYVARIGTHAGFSNICYIICLVYLDRLADESSDVHLYVTSLTAHRLLVAGLLVAAKFTEDAGSLVKLDNDYYTHVGKVTGMSISELKHLERDLLQALGHNAFVTAEELLRYSSGLARESGSSIVSFQDGKMSF